MEALGEELGVVTNFGMLSPSDTGWQLICEETIGGLLLDVQADSSEALASTGSGLFRQSGGVCDWQAGPTSEDGGTILGFAVAGAESDQQVTFALVGSNDTEEIHLERADESGDFTLLYSFENSSGYRDVFAAGDAPSVFVAGYAYEPRTWNLAYSFDGGVTFSEVSPDVDNDTLTMIPRLVDPTFSHALLIQVGVPGAAHEIWRFDADTSEMTQLLTLQDNEVYGGMALSGDSLWVAGKRTGGGSLYRADREALEFSRVIDSGPEFACLAASGDVLYACVNDFTYASEFIVGTSADEGQSWTAFLTLSDLGSVSGCGDECSATEAWLTTDYGVPDTSVPDAPAGGPDASTEPASTPQASNEVDSGCHVGSRPTRHHSFGWLGLLLSLLFRRSRPAIFS